MKQLILFFVLLPFFTFGQGPIAQEIAQLLQAGKVDEAEERVEYYLSKNPKEVDAIMMKGNVILNKECCDQTIVLEANTDESIYNTSIGFMGSRGPMTVSEVTGTKVADLWKLAVSYDLSRTDIHFGICQIYSISMMTDELIDYLPTLKKHVGGEDKLHYSMCDYARNLKERGDFESAIRVYQFVMTLYPSETGLYSDIAAEYFFHGDIDLAKEHIDRALLDENLDQMSIGNAFFFNSVMGEYDEALACLKRQATITKVDEYLFYEGLLSLARGLEWKSFINAYLTMGQDPNLREAASYLLSGAFDGSFNAYLKLNEMKLNDGYKILIHEAYKSMTPDQLAPAFNYAELLTYNKIYDDAIKEFERIEGSGLVKDEADKEKVAYYYAWALWASGRKELSLPQWRKLEDSDNFQHKSASAYFRGKYHFDLGEKGKAKKYFEKVRNDPSKSKYATMAWNYYNSLK